MNKVLGAAIPLFAATLVFATVAIAQDNTPSLQIITPSEGQTIYGDKVPVLFSVENFNLVDFEKSPGLTPASGGHILLWLDDPNPTKESAAMVVEDSFTYSDVSYGNHTLKAELVNNDNSPLYSPKTVSVTFKSEALTPPTDIASSGFDKNTAVVILGVVALVILAAWWYTKEEDESPKRETLKVKKQATSKPKTRRRKK